MIVSFFLWKFACYRPVANLKAIHVWVRCLDIPDGLANDRKLLTKELEIATDDIVPFKWACFYTILRADLEGTIFAYDSPMRLL